MSKKQSGKSVKAQTKATEKARRDAIAATQANIEKIEAGEGGEARPAPQPLTDAERAGAQQVASVDVDPAKETAAAEKHAARGKKGGKSEKPAKQSKPAKSAKSKAAKEPKPKRLSALDAAAQVLAKSDKPMTAQAMIDEMAAKDLWKSPGGATPASTLYAALIREIGSKGKDARFKKVDRGLFVATGKGA